MAATTRGELLGRLRLHFNRDPVDRDRFAEYVRELSDVPVPVLEEAVTVLVRTQTEPWFPTVGRIREVCAEVTLRLPSEQGALAEVDAVIAWGRSDGTERTGRPPALHPLVRSALTAVGGTFAFRQAEQPAVVRGQFLKTYRGLRAAEITGAQLALALPAGESA